MWFFLSIHEEAIQDVLPPSPCSTRTRLAVSAQGDSCNIRAHSYDDIPDSLRRENNLKHKIKWSKNPHWFFILFQQLPYICVIFSCLCYDIGDISTVAFIGASVTLTSGCRARALHIRRHDRWRVSACWTSALLYSLRYWAEFLSVV